MTAKQAIKTRCLDCNGLKCEFVCPLFGLAKPKANVNRIEAIRQYCQWCMNRNPVNQCTSPSCPIYQYRAAAKGNIGVAFLPLSSQKNYIDDNDDSLNSETSTQHGTENESRRNVHSVIRGGCYD
jgi:hypothetical protein